MKHIGIIYCGGCNPRYNREEVYETLVEALDGIADIELAKRGVTYDHLVIIGGCTSCCASYDKYLYAGCVYKIRERSDLDYIADLIKKL